MQEKDYANRDDEFMILDEALKHYNIVYIYTNKATGISSFLNEYIRLSKYFNIYIDASTKISIDQLLINYILKSKYTDKLQQYANKKFGKKSEKLINSIILGIPYVGNVVSHLVDSKEAPSIYLGNYSSALSELLLPFFREFSNQNKINIYIDSADYIHEQSFQIIGELGNISNISLILVFNEKKNTLIKLQNFLALTCANKSFEFVFKDPNLKLITELANYYQLNLSKDKLLNIFNHSQNNIHIINKEFIDIKNNTYFYLENIHKYILVVLSVTKFEVSYIELYNIIKIMNIQFNLQQLLPNALKNLEIYGYIKENQSNYSLISNNHPEIKSIFDNYADYILTCNAIYSYYYKKIENIDLIHIKLLYKLSKILDLNTKNEIAKIIISRCLEMGHPIESSLYESIIFKSNKRDSYIQMLYHCRERNYTKSLKFVNKLKKTKLKDSLTLLEIEGILNNRIRNFDKAEIILLKCLDIEDNASNKGIVIAYLCANYIHLYNNEKAISLFNSNIDIIENTANCGYVYRNIASAFSDKDKKLECLKKAVTCFKNFDDNFGIGTTLCNLGYNYCLNNEPEIALDYFHESISYLKTFGFEHLHIIYNDLGICYLLLNKPHEAYKYLSVALKLAKNNMPKILISINLCYSLLLTGQGKKGIEILNKVSDIVAQHKLIHLQKKYYDNKLIIHYLIGDLENYVLSQSENSINQNLLLRLRKNSSTVKDKYELFKKFYIKSGLVYWYIDPLKLF